MTTPNFENRALFHGDNLAFLSGMNSETVDLIATDPPFNKNRDFHAMPDSLAKGRKIRGSLAVGCGRASRVEGDLVLDPFAGCATTCVAAERLGRE